MQDIISQLVSLWQAVLRDFADEAAREVGFVRRSVKVSGSDFALTLIMGFLANPTATYNDLCQFALSAGLMITPQGLEQRFTPEAAAFMLVLLEKLVADNPGIMLQTMDLLAGFNGVWSRDSSIITLPDELTTVWSGVGGSAGETAALKLQVDFDYASGRVHGPVLQNGRTHDQKSPYQAAYLPAGALHLADLGYFSLDRLARDSGQGVFWITRLKVGTGVRDENSQSKDLVSLMSEQSGPRVDIPVQIGKINLPCRLVAERVPPEVADQRIERLQESARKKQTPVSERRKQLAHWTVLVTNVPEERLNSEQVLIMMRIRWQVELLFKLWKSHAKVDEWRSENPWRILCETYAKLLGMLLMHLIFQASIWKKMDRSLFQAAKFVQKYAMSIANAFSDAEELRTVLTKLCNLLPATCKQQRRRKHPATYQLAEGLA